MKKYFLLLGVLSSLSAISYADSDISKDIKTMNTMGNHIYVTYNLISGARAKCQTMDYNTTISPGKSHTETYINFPGISEVCVYQTSIYTDSARQFNICHVTTALFYDNNGKITSQINSDSPDTCNVTTYPGSILVG
ncbi:MAG: hypothetical protein RLZZ293_978 [Pseudomonadota bacterium]|jgi:hypothetical protein